MWGCLVLLICHWAAADLLLTRREQGEVYIVRRKSAELILSNLTLPTSAVASVFTNSLFVSSDHGIYAYNLSQPNASSVLVYEGGLTSSLALDVWGNLYFADSALNTISVIYAGVKNATVLYDNYPNLRSPSAIAIDDYEELLFWANGYNGTLHGSIHLALKEPINGRGDLTSWLNEESTESLVLSRNRMYVSTNTGLLVTNKHNPSNWDQLPTLLGSPKVLAVEKNQVFVSDTATGTLYKFQEDKGAEDCEEVAWAPTGVTHMSVVLSSYAIVLAAVTWTLAV